MVLEEEDFYCSYLRCNFTIILFLEGLLIAMYAINTEPDLSTTSLNVQCILANALAVFGFGLLLIKKETHIKQVFTFIFVVMCLNGQLWPLFSKFWNAAFARTLGDAEKIKLDIEFIRLSAFMTISFLVGIWGTITKIGIITLNLLVVVFAIGFSLNYETNMHVYLNDGVDKEIFDDLMIGRVFLFGSGFSLLYLATRRFFIVHENTEQKQETPEYIHFISLLGLAFIIALFPYILDTRILSDRSKSSLNVYFAFGSTIVTHMSFVLIWKSIFTLKDLKICIFSGVLQIGILSSFISDPFIAIIIGFLSGFLTAFFYLFFSPKLKKVHFSEASQTLFVFLMNSVIGTLVIIPIVIAASSANSAKLANLNPAYHMIYSAISLGIGSSFGLVGGLGERFLGEKRVYEDENFFNPEGSSEEEEKEEEVMGASGKGMN